MKTTKHFLFFILALCASTPRQSQNISQKKQAEKTRDEIRTQTSRYMGLTSFSYKDLA